jgi:MYXO-CTERM domain-containing protein
MRIQSFALIAAAIATPAMANQILDQNQPSGAFYLAGFSQGDLAQSFQSQLYSQICGAGVLLQSGVGGTDNVTISLWDALPNAGGSMLATGSAQGTEGQWVDVSWSPTNITPNATYYLVFDGNTSLGIAGDNDVYGFGQCFANPGFGSFPQFDYAFRTWVPVPTPGAAALLAFGGLAAARRRRA